MVFSTLDELVNKQHWWWDTLAANDGGALNDLSLRLFYSHCLQKHHEEMGSTAARSRSRSTCNSINNNKKNENKLQHHNAATGGATGAGADADAKQKEDHVDILPLANNLELNQFTNNDCSASPFVLSTINVGSSSGKCGLQIISQNKYQSLSTVDVRCGDHGLDSYMAHFGHSYDQQNNMRVSIATTALLHRCILTTTNVRRLRVSSLLERWTSQHAHTVDANAATDNNNNNNTSFRNHFLSMQMANQGVGIGGQDESSIEVSIDGTVLLLPVTNMIWRDLRHLQPYLDICWEDTSRQPAICHDEMIDPLVERTLHNSGPIRQVL